MSGYTSFMSQTWMGPPPTVDKKSKYVLNIFVQKGPSENKSLKCPIFVASQAGDWRQKRRIRSFYSWKSKSEKEKEKLDIYDATKQDIFLQLFYECNEANISVTSAIKQILVLRVQWSKY